MAYVFKNYPKLIFISCEWSLQYIAIDIKSTDQQVHNKNVIVQPTGNTVSEMQAILANRK